MNQTNRNEDHCIRLDQKDNGWWVNVRTGADRWISPAGDLEAQRAKLPKIVGEMLSASVAELSRLLPAGAADAPELLAALIDQLHFVGSSADLLEQLSLELLRGAVRLRVLAATARGVTLEGSYVDQPHHDGRRGAMLEDLDEAALQVEERLVRLDLQAGVDSTLDAAEQLRAFAEGGDDA